MNKTKISTIIYSIIFIILIQSTSFGAIKLNYDGTVHNYTAEPITLKVNGKTLNPEMPPVIIDGRTLVPARAVFEELGAEIKWVAEVQEIFITLGKNIINLKIGSNKAIINNDYKTMEVGPKIINDSTMIPLRFVAEALNFEVGWDSKSRIASVDSKPGEAETEPSTEETNGGSDEPDKIIQEIINSQTTISTEEQTSSEEQTTFEIEEPTTFEQPTYNQNIDNNFNQVNGDIIRFKGNTIYDSNADVNVEIKQETHELVDLIGINFPTNNGEIFEIIASGKMSNINYGTIENRLYIDISGSNSKLPSNIDVVGSNLIKSIRTAPQADSKNVTRIVFDDIPNNQSYSIYLSDDRTRLFVKFKSIFVDEITFQSFMNQDIINIYTNSEFTPVISELSNPERLIIDIPNSLSTIGNNSADVSSNLVSTVRTSQFDNNTVRIVLDLKQAITYEISSNKLCTTIKLIEPTYRNISYQINNGSPQLILKKDNYNIDLNLLAHQDKYLDGYYKIILPDDYSQIYGYGEYKINDTYLESVELQTSNGYTELRFNQKNIYAYTVTDDNDNIYINILNPKQVYQNIVLIDPGHGGKFPGNTNNGIVEKVVTLDVSNRLYLLLENDPDIKVYATRTTDEHLSTDQSTDLQMRADMANQVSDMFISIHCNSIENANVSGVQVFYRDPNQTNGIISKQMANIFNKTVSESLSIPIRPANQELGYSYLILKQSKVPACLIEMGFLTNKTDAAILASPSGRQSAAEGIYEGIKQSLTLINN